MYNIKHSKLIKEYKKGDMILGFLKRFGAKNGKLLLNKGS
jgi:hypothetical protein